MRVPAALRRWAAEHNSQLSEGTLAEVEAIAAAIADSPLANRSIADTRTDPTSALAEIFNEERTQRAASLIGIVGEWATKRNLVDTSDPMATGNDALDAVIPPAKRVVPHIDRPGAVDPQPGPRPTPAPSRMEPEPIEAPAFLRSDKVDEEDDQRIYGGRRSRTPWLFGLLGLLALAAAGAGIWWGAIRDDGDSSETVTQEQEAPVETPSDPAPVAESAPELDDGSEPTAESDPSQEPTAETESGATSAWADIAPILNSGTAPISASTYAVSPANRAVLTGHTDAITGIVVSNDGRVLTSGADRRLVDWGVDVTLDRPDVLNVASPLTVLTRTSDQRMIAGDTDGNITVIDLVNQVDPLVIPVHSVAISAATELADGRLAIASVDGDLSIFDLDTPDDTVDLAHGAEITAAVGLPDGRLATAAIDGLVRLWAADAVDDSAVETIETLGRPVTALALLDDGTLASASVDGLIHITAPSAGATPTFEVQAHPGAIRALLGITMGTGQAVLVSGGDDSSIRLWDVATGDPMQVLEGHGDLVSGLNVLPDSRLVSISADGTGRVWDLTVEPGVVVIAPHEQNLSAIEPWRNDQFVTGGVDGLVVLASTSETSAPTAITRHGAPIVGLDVLVDGSIVSLDASSLLRVNPGDGSAQTLEAQLPPGGTALQALGDLVVTGHADGSVRLTDLAADTGDEADSSTGELGVVSAHGSGVNDVASLSNGLVVSAGQDMTVRIIDFEDPTTVPVFDLHSAPVDVVVELPDGRVASAGSDGIYIWSTDTLAEGSVRLTGHRARTISLVGLSDNRLLSTATDGRVRIWDLNDPSAEPITLIDIPGIVNPYLIQSDNGLLVAGAGRGYVVFSLS